MSFEKFNINIKTSHNMPEISRFLGIVISMYYDDHNPPHFHAKYGSYELTVFIESGITKGIFPKRALRAVLDWYDIHKDTNERMGISITKERFIYN